MKLSDRDQWRVFYQKWGQIFVGHTQTYLTTFYFLLQHCVHIRINAISRMKKIKGWVGIVKVSVLWEEKQNMSRRKALVLGVVIKYLFQIIIFSVLTMSRSCQMERYCWEIEQKIERGSGCWLAWLRRCLGSVGGSGAAKNIIFTLGRSVPGDKMTATMLEKCQCSLCVTRAEVLVSF